MIEQQETEKLVIEALKEIQSRSGRPEIEITNQTFPLEELTNFDSLNALETESLLAERLGQKIDKRIFWDEKRNPLQICEVATRLLRFLSIKPTA
jgi:acyl carrier protein